MEIKLNEKTYVTGKIKARMVRKAIEVSENINTNNMKATDLDNLIDYIVELFGGQFSRDDVYDGLDARELMPTLLGCINSVVGEMGGKLEQFPNEQAGT